ncbi:MAG: CHAT domain-containing protein [Cyanobacteria bacterium P01_H01_bin.162]
MTQEFHLSITSLGSDRYLIRTEDAAAGVPVAEAQVDWPVDEWLQLAQPAMDEPLMGLLQGTVDLSDRPAGLPQLGSKLYNALFQDEAIRESWLRARGIAQNRHEVLRLRLGLKESRLQRLPWEVLQHSGQPLTTRPNLTFARYAANPMMEPTAGAPQRLEVGTSINVLLVIAGPEDQDQLQLLQEAGHIRELFASQPGEATPVCIDVLEQPDRALLTQKLEQGTYQVLHYAGHSDFGKNGGDLSLVNRQTGLTERLSGDDLAGLLVNNHVALAVFNSCRSGHTAADDAEMDWRQQNLVQALVNRGVPGVVAMAERIPDEVAIAFTRLFYHNLRIGFPIDMSLSRTRQGLISGFGSDQHYWALPILYLQPDFDGYLTQGGGATDESLDTDLLPLNPPVPLPRSEPAPAAAVPPPPAAPLVNEPEVPEILEVPEVPLAEGVTATLLTELETSPLPDADEDELLVSYVEQLSKNATSTDEPPMPADQGEVLVSDPTRQAGLEIYETLPEVPPPTHTSPLPPARSTTTHPPDRSATPTPNASASRRYLPRSPEKPILVWFALGLVGVVGMMGLGLLAIRWSENGVRPPVLSTTTPSLPSEEPQPANADAFTLIKRGEDALKQNRYADARDEFDQALTQALIGNADPTTVSDAIWPWVVDTPEPDLLYIKGRIAWQESSLMQSEPEDVNSRYEGRIFAQQARTAWERTPDRFIKGRIARGFADYAMGDWDSAIANWEAALTLYDEQRRRQPNPAAAPADLTILHAYAGLVMAHTTLGNINPAGLEEDAGLQQASADEQAILDVESANELALAQDYFLTLQRLDELERMTPRAVSQIDESPHTWNNWLWTPTLLQDWRRDYRYWDAETRSVLTPGDLPSEDLPLEDSLPEEASPEESSSEESSPE